ncbi:MAG: hypothetical protein ABEI97_00280 [Candidatus Nanohaloarchaea archaeon]
MSTSRRSRGQSSLEFIVMLILVLLVFTSFVTLFSGKHVDALERERRRIALSVADRAAFELDLALVEGEGYSRTFELRESIGVQDYNITVNGTTVLLEYGDGDSVLSSTAADNVTGSIDPGTNTVANDGGVITVTQP